MAINVLNASGSSVSVATQTTSGGTNYNLAIAPAVISPLSAPVSSTGITLSAYTAGRAIGSTALEFTNATVTSGHAINVKSIEVTIDDGAIAGGGLYLYLFTAAPPAPTNNVLYTPAYATAASFKKRLTLTGEATGNWGAYRWDGEMLCFPAATSLYGVVTAASSFTFTLATATGLKARLLGFYA
ncbi:hypothetical protein [Prochlorothrix hollandica]|uniref:hypothetical protein n=1 Tax=Prochlorothrix hollandica TaxID=1223 RepID=UPI003340985D